MFSSLDLEHDKALAARLGGRARAGTSREAAAFGEVVLMAVPYSALPQLGRDLAASIKGKVVLDACNPFPSRDGDGLCVIPGHRHPHALALALRNLRQPRITDGVEGAHEACPRQQLC